MCRKRGIALNGMGLLCWIDWINYKMLLWIAKGIGKILHWTNETNLKLQWIINGECKQIIQITLGGNLESEGWGIRSKRWLKSDESENVVVDCRYEIVTLDKWELKEWNRFIVVINFTTQNIW